MRSELCETAWERAIESVSQKTVLSQTTMFQPSSKPAGVVNSVRTLLKIHWDEIAFVVPLDFARQRLTLLHPTERSTSPEVPTSFRVSRAIHFTAAQ